VSVQDVIDIFSSTSVYVTPTVNGHKLSDATGFLWLTDQEHYWLVTNWHVLSGRNQESGSCLHSSGGIPDSLTVFFQNLEVKHDPIQVAINLRDGESSLWKEHPQLGSKVDIAAVRLDVPKMEQANYFPINAVPEMKLRQRVGDRVFIVGFPFGRQGYGFPIWKAGTFASEPCLTKFDDPVILVDSASRPGMSGSPVIQREYGELELEDGDFGRTENQLGGARLVGVYSGRCQTRDPNDAQLGRVWPIRLVREMMEGA
jgi:hypothetical protein